MPVIDANQVKTVLLGMKAQKQAGKGGNNAEAFRQGIASKREATRLLSSIVTPFTPAQVTIDTPFLIWASGNSNILVNSQIVPGSSWAKIFSKAASDEVILSYDEVDFYFFWQNSTGQPAVVNVESFMMLDGACVAAGKSGYIPLPIWIGGTIGNAHVDVGVHLYLLEWWNQPPTTPLAEPGQLQDAASISDDGAWMPFDSSHGTSKSISANYHVYYDKFYIPSDGVAVFQVGLTVKLWGIKGECIVDFSDDPFIVICPHLQLEISTTPQSIVTSLP
jgi:hypothetical protein